MQVKATMRYHLTAIRMVNIRKTKNKKYKCWQGCGEIEPSCTVGGNVIWCSCMENLTTVMEVSQKTKSRTTIWPNNLTCAYISKRTERRISERYLHTHVHCSIIHNSQEVEATQLSINRWMDKENVVYTYNGIFFSHKREWSSDTCYNMNEPW